MLRGMISVGCQPTPGKVPNYNHDRFCTISKIKEIRKNVDGTARIFKSTGEVLNTEDSYEDFKKGLETVQKQLSTVLDAMGNNPIYVPFE